MLKKIILPLSSSAEPRKPLPEKTSLEDVKSKGPSSSWLQAHIPKKRALAKIRNLIKRIIKNLYGL